MEYIDGLVSVIIPTYKRSAKLTRALNSVLNQTYTNIELLLINDNEPDDEFTVALKLRVNEYEKDSRFNLINQDKHYNGAVARNIGIRRAKGQYIAFLDDDDWWESNKIAEQVKILEKLDSSWGGVSCKFTLYDQSGSVIGRTSKYPDGYIYKDILNLLTDVATGTLLLRHKAFDTTRYFDTTLLRHQDLQLLVDFTSKYQLMEVDQYLHCVDVSDTQNRPDPLELIRYKKAFFNSVKPIMNALSVSERKCIYAMHKYELGYVCIKYGDWISGVKYCLAIFSSPIAFSLAIRKTVNKAIQIINKG